MPQFSWNVVITVGRISLDCHDNYQSLKMQLAKIMEKILERQIQQILPTFKDLIQLRLPQEKQDVLKVVNIVIFSKTLLTLPAPIPDEEKKLKFFFALLCVASKDFIKALKAFIKPFEVPQRSGKIKL